jgi:tRNA threonylcarbamoyladenosine biosynthesis protein TsaE
MVFDPAQAGPAVSRSEAETEAIGESLARTLGAGAVVLIDGPLGAGKTAFVRGMARGLNAPAGDVSSPTFTLLQEYAGRVTLYHADLYRLSSKEVDDLGLSELSAEGVLAVEWPDRWTVPPGDAITIVIEKRSDGERLIRTSGERYSTR